MLDNYKSIPFLAGISILLITPLSMGAFVYSSFRADSTDQSTETEKGSTAKSDSFGGSASSNIKAAPLPLSESGSGGGNADSTTGIPTGTYSNPPTTIETGSEELIPTTSRSPINNFESSVDRNRAIQQTMNDLSNHSVPDYSSPASSNNYQDTQDNSLITPVEDDSLTTPVEEDSLLEAPDSNSEAIPLTPSTEPISQP
jgi:hypothetical protein